MSLTAKALKFKMRWFPDKASYWAEKLFKSVNLLPLIPVEDHKFVVSLVLDFRRWWRHVQAKNTQFTALVHNGIWKVYPYNLIRQKWKLMFLYIYNWTLHIVSNNSRSNPWSSTNNFLLARIGLRWDYSTRLCFYKEIKLSMQPFLSKTDIKKSVLVI